ncbi:MAG: HAMP domain-containing sensor histidine kinase [Lachnospiraceae bacterium]|nr:HAMP domain-containing sensor histidine kinase [Lachnospiraceae bacterium]
MFRELRKKIIFIQIIAFLVVTVLIVGTINLNAYQQMVRSAHQVLEMLSDSEGIFPELIRTEGNSSDTDFGFGSKMTEETSYITRYFYVRLGTDGEILEYNLDHIASVTSDDVADFTAEVLNRSKSEGMIDSYRYLKKTIDDEISIYFVDCYTQQNYVHYVMRISIIVAILCMIFVCIFVYLLSDKAIAPLEENLEKQRRFITDASHELKTPLAAISANADVLELMVGENEITEKIKRQTKQLNGLVNEMLTLSRMDGIIVKKEDYENIDFSALVQSCVSDFSAITVSQKKTLTMDVKSKIQIRGVRKDIIRLVSVLLDNAIKYCQEEGAVRVCLIAPSAKTVRLEIHNTCEPLPRESLPHLFERFYRTDVSRCRDTGSYGIGLSIAKAIVINHKGKIGVKNEADGVCFFVELPLHKAGRRSSEYQDILQTDVPRKNG